MLSDVSKVYLKLLGRNQWADWELWEWPSHTMKVVAYITLF